MLTFTIESIVLCVLFTVSILSQMKKPLRVFLYSYPPRIVDRVIDPENEHLIQQAISELTSGKSVQQRILDIDGKTTDAILIWESRPDNTPMALTCLK